MKIPKIFMKKVVPEKVPFQNYDVLMFRSIKGLIYVKNSSFQFFPQAKKKKKLFE